MSAAVRALGGLRDEDRSGWSTLTRVTGSAIFVLLVFVLVEALFESWMLVLLAERSTDSTGVVTLAMPAWPKTARNGVYIAIASLTVVHVVTKGWIARFMTRADFAFAFLALVLVVAGVAGGSSLRLTAEAVFVYLRAAIVFYAIRAIAPPGSQYRPVLWLMGGIIVLNAVVATALAWVGPTGYSALGFADLSWAYADRAQALQAHPNHLGHILGLAMIGLLALFATSRTVRIRWWFVFGLLALALALTQSRESLVGILAGLVVVAILQRGHLRAVAGGALLIVALTGVAWTIQPGNWESLARRLEGVISAVKVPSGSEGGVTCNPLAEDCTVNGLPKRENRVLYLQQGLDLWSRSPLIGYGVGQFGGSVASQNDPLWYQNPKFGPGGFNMHGFTSTQVDSFSLHLLVEAGLVGTIAYLAWYALIGWPSVVTAWRARRVSGGNTDPPRDLVHPFHLWAAAALVFGLVVAAFSPALEDPLFAPLLMGIVGLAWVIGSVPSADPQTAELGLGATLP
jgi:O-antigen ligase